MNLKNRTKPALLLVDIQKGFDLVDYWGGQRNNADAEQRAGRLLNVWREHGLPIFHIRHRSSDPTSPLNEAYQGNQFKEAVKPLAGEPVISKNVNSAFIGTDLQQRLDEERILRLVIVGLTTDHCVSTTARMAGNLGFEVTVVSDATATFDRLGIDGQTFAADLIHKTALASLNGEFATVVNSAALLKNLFDR